jgi:hypothetical protein
LRDIRFGVRIIVMSILLDKAIEKARELPEPEQDIAAAELLGVLSDFPTPEERIALTEGRAAYERGEFVTLDQWRHEMGLDTH